LGNAKSNGFGHGKAPQIGGLGAGGLARFARKDSPVVSFDCTVELRSSRRG
jgi:hypothetical protein